MKSFIFVFLLLAQVAFSQVIHKIYFDRFSHYDVDDWTTYAFSNAITSIDIGEENIYFGTTHGGILRYNFFSDEWLSPQTTSNGLYSNKINYVVYDDLSDQLYAVTQKGVQVFNKGFQYWKAAIRDLPARQNPEYTNQNRNATRLPEFSRPDVSSWPSLIPKGHFELMLDGLIYDPDNDEYNITDRVVDRWYKLWFGTNGTGIGKADLDMQELQFIKQSLSAIYPRDVFIKGKAAWIGGTSFRQKERGIVRWDFEEGTWNYFRSGIGYKIFSDEISVVEGIDSLVFFGTEQGLLQFNTKRGTWLSLQKAFPLKNDVIFDLFTLNNILYIASDNGAYKYDPVSQVMQSISKKFLQHINITKIAGTKKSVCLASDRGIFEYNASTDKTSLLSSRAAIADNFIDAVGVNHDTLWYAGQNGIGFYDIKNDKWQSFPATNFQLNTKINDIAFTDWSVWFATNIGVLKYDIDRDYWYLYTTKDGLADNRVYNIDVNGDDLWLSTFGGITIFKWYREGRFE